MIKTIEVPTSEMEIVRCPQHDIYHGGACYGVKPKYYDGFYYVGTEKECQEHLKWLKRLERF